MDERPPDFTVLIGHPQNGKTTAAEFNSRTTGRRFASTSGLCYEALAQRWGVSVADLRARPKEEIRDDLAVIGDEIFDKDPKAFGVKLAQNGFTIIDGVRRRKELYAVQEHPEREGFNVRTLWSENPRQPRTADNTEVTPADADEIINNDGTVDQFHARLTCAIARQLPKTEVTRLHRAEATPDPNAPRTWVDDAIDSDPDLRGHREARGRWFADNLEEVQWYFDDSPEGRRRMVYIDLPTFVAEQCRVSNLAKGEKPAVGEPDPASYSRRQEKEFFLPKGLASLAQPASTLPKNVSEKSLAEFFNLMDKSHFDRSAETWTEGHDYSICTSQNAAPARELHDAGFDVEICGLEECTPNMGKDGLVGGHDWLVARKDGFEFIVDPWRMTYLGKGTAVVSNPQEVAQWYGPRDDWVHVSGVNTFEADGWFGKHCAAITRDWDDYSIDRSASESIALAEELHACSAPEIEAR